jgi:hypothetical protein
MHCRAIQPLCLQDTGRRRAGDREPGDRPATLWWKCRGEAADPVLVFPFPSPQHFLGLFLRAAGAPDGK